jgi:NADH-quinone oxidoreductase subunit F
MPVGSMVKHFRDEFEAYIEDARERNGLGALIPQVNRARHAGPYPMLAPAGTDPSVAVA